MDGWVDSVNVDGDLSKKNNSASEGRLLGSLVVFLYVVLAVCVLLHIGTGYVQSFAGGSAVEGHATEAGYFVANQDFETEVSRELFLILFVLERYISPIALACGVGALILLLCLAGWISLERREGTAENKVPETRGK